MTTEPKLERALTQRILTLALEGKARVLKVAPISDSTGVVPLAAKIMPIGLIGLWWLTSFTLYVAGWPIAYLHTNVALVSMLTLGTLLLTVGGFVITLRKPPFAISSITDTRPPWPAVTGLLMSIVLLFFFAEYYSGYHLWQIGAALVNQGEAFEEASDRIAAGTQSRLWIVAAQTIAAPLTMAVVPYFALAWFERRRYFGYLVVAVAVPIAQSILVARDFQLVLTAILLGCAWLASRVRRRVYFNWRDSIILGGSAVVALVAFSARKMSRNPENLPICPPGSVGCIRNPTLWDYIATSAASYATHAFEGLGRALEGRWAFGGGFAHVPAIQSLLDNIFGKNDTVVITDQLSRHDWDDAKLWSTGLSWLANDVPWVLVPLLVAAQAVLLAIAWRRTLRTGDALSLTLFSFSFLSLLFMMQNLQLALSGPVYVGYFSLAIAFLGRHLYERRRTGLAKDEIPV